MKKNLKSKIQHLKVKDGVAFLWDESFLWGLMAYKALKAIGLRFDLIRSEEIKAGALDRYRMLFVPGGWASNKRKALGDAGVKAIRDFVSKGGNYLGFCGGAGLATMTKDGIGLLNIKRKKSEERVPSFSGRIYLNIYTHSIWRNVLSDVRQSSQPAFHVWWPSQFQIEDDSIKVLATYGKALPDSFSSDLNVGDVESYINWSELENEYRINLDPRRLYGEPAVVEGNYGMGKVILSLVHFDTPGDINGQYVLKNLWKYLAREEPKPEIQQVTSEQRKKRNPYFELYCLCSELIHLGERNFLWFWKNPMLLQWRRGVRGLEYNTLYIMLREIYEILDVQNININPHALKRIKNLCVPFLEKSKKLLILERVALNRGYITYERCDDPKIQRLRMELFSTTKHHRGMFKKLLDEVDRVLFSLLSNKHN
jgi:putative intracellular protease/amidase